MCFRYSIFSRVNAGDSQESGSEYLQAFAKFLKAEYMNKSVQDIFDMVDVLLR